MRKTTHRREAVRRKCCRAGKWVFLAMCGLGAVLAAGCSQIQDAYARLSAAAVQNQAPIALQLWHGFTGREREVLEDLAGEFNASAGKENRIQLNLTGYDSLSAVSEAVFQAAREEAEKTDDLPRLPDLFFSLDDAAYVLDRMGWAVHMEEFLTEEQRRMFLDSVQAEACPGEDGSMVLFPIGIDTDVLLVNESRWSEFCRDTAQEGELVYTDRDLLTWERLGEAAKAYGEWSARKDGEALLEGSPDEGEPPEGGTGQEMGSPFPLGEKSAFFCTDSWGRLLVAGYECLGKRMFVAEPDSVRFSFDRGKIRSFWSFWSEGWKEGSFSPESCRDAFSSGEAAACLTSTIQARNISNRVVSGEGSNLVNVSILPAPSFSGGDPVTIQETLGLVLTRGSREKQAAAQVFLQWLADEERIADISVASGRLPAMKRAVADSVLNGAFQRQGLSPLEQRILRQAKVQLYSHIQLPLAVFDGGSDVIDTMDRLLLSGGQEVRQEAREESLLSVSGGEAATGEEDAGQGEVMSSDTAYEQWYLSFRDSVVDLVLIGRKAA